ncbi:MAG: methyl-accepting chemotaxis protein [Sporolactobacillus sp.]
MFKKSLEFILSIAAKIRIRALFIPLIILVFVIPNLFVFWTIYRGVDTLCRQRLHVGQASVNAIAWPIIGNVALIALISIILVIVAIWFAVQFIFLNPMKNFNAHMKAIAGRDLSHRLKQTDATNKEFALLKENFEAMTESLRTIIRTLSGKSTSVSESAYELTAMTKENKSSGTEISAALAGVARSVDTQLQKVNAARTESEAITGAVASITMLTMALNASTDQLRGSMSSGESNVQLTTQRMETIKATVTTLADLIEKLSQQTKDINTIIQAISDVADQTQILSFNASIEAARAGEEGRGFAVVAGEISKLADQSADSVQQVTRITAKIQEETSQVVASMRTGVAEVDQGMSAVYQTDKAFQQIEEYFRSIQQQVEQVDSGIDTISKASFKAASSYQAIEQMSHQTTEDAKRISEATDEQTAAVDEVASSANSLSEDAQELKAVASSFQF